MGKTGHFATITTAGGLLPVDLLERLAQPQTDVPGATSADYHLIPGQRLRDAINRSWTELQGAWATFGVERGRLSAGERATTVTRERWLLPLFDELGFGRLARAAAVSLDGHDFPVSHAWGQVPIHLLGADVDLDHRTKGVAGAAGAAPQSMVQDLLNRSDNHLWALLSNGLRLRLMRDNVSFARAAYVEFDLEAIFDGQVFTDFVVLWMVCHQSRFEAERLDECWLEQWVTLVRDQGVRALDSLRTGFERAITVLGAGFLAHSHNRELKDALASGALSREDYYHQVLRVVYRLVFLLVAEDRDLLHPPPPAADQAARDRYTRYYSVGRLRDLARRERASRHGDLWESLRPVIRGLGDSGVPAIGIPALGSFLWSREVCPDLDKAMLSNRYLVDAISHLAFVQRESTRTRVDFVNLGPEELGSVYEGLLELQPHIGLLSGTFELLTVSGSQRKSSGSYYTPTTLIQALLELSLDHLLDEAVATGSREAILSLKVLDPACGSGHFLTAAAQRIAGRLASLDTGEVVPTPTDVRHALREVVGRCIFGIDRNPMAVELAKVNLWLDTMEPGRPLSFLDHHIICGNALLGSTPALLVEGVPNAAFQPLEGDDKATAATLRKRNAQQRRQENQDKLALGSPVADAAALLEKALYAIAEQDDTSVAGVERQRELWQSAQSAAHTQVARLAADTWCAAFFAPKTSDHPPITEATFRAAEDNRVEDSSGVEEVERLSTYHRFLHPHLAFPAVLGPGGATGPDGWAGGFDLVFGNPPWDTLSPDLKEFFAAYDPEVRTAKKSDQEAIVQLLLADPGIAQRWSTTRRDLYTSVHFMKNSGRYHLFAPGNLGKGDFNVYRMFVEAAMALARPGGWVAQIVPAGMYAGANAAAIRRELYDNWQLTHVLGFVNTKKTWFPAVKATTRFSLYSAHKDGATDRINVAFDLVSAGDLARALAGGTVGLRVQDIRASSPETLAIPEVSDEADAALTGKMSAQCPPLGDVSAGPPVRFYQREVDMGNDRDLFDEDIGLPVYEGRMVAQYDYRARAYRSGRALSAVWENLPFRSPGKAIRPQWRLPEDRIPNKVGDRVWRYRVGWCDVASLDMERCLIAALVPPGTICGHKVPVLNYPEEYDWAYMVWLALANSFCMDYLARKKVTLSMSMTLLDSLPFPRLALDHPLVARLGPLALRLTCTGPEMTDYWNAMSAHGWCEPVPDGAPPPGYVDEGQRAEARAEIDAVVCQEVFGLTIDEVTHVLDSFEILRRKEEKLVGAFRTKERVLEYLKSQ